MEREWRTNRLEPPKIGHAINEKSGEKFLVISDKSTIVKMINRNGNIYMVASFRCDVKSNTLGNYYSCKEPLHLVSCSKLDDPKDVFARDVLVKKYLL